MRDLVLQAEKDAFSVYGHNAVEIALRLLGDRGDFAFDTCIIAGAVKPPICFDGLGDQRLDVAGFGHVRFNKDSVATILFHQGDGFISAGGVHVADNQG